jgi:hypothetical protein
VTAAALLREAAVAGISVRLADGKPKVSGNPSPELLARLRELKPAIVAILAGDACRTCGVALAWPRPVGVTFADGTAECHRCADDEAERLFDSGRRAVESPDALVDPAERMVQRDGLS